MVICTVPRCPRACQILRGPISPAAYCNHIKGSSEFDQGLLKYKHGLMLSKQTASLNVIVMRRDERPLPCDIENKVLLTYDICIRRDKATEFAQSLDDIRSHT